MLQLPQTGPLPINSLQDFSCAPLFQSQLIREEILTHDLSKLSPPPAQKAKPQGFIDRGWSFTSADLVSFDLTTVAF